jgi:chromosome segregation ATPase
MGIDEQDKANLMQSLEQQPVEKKQTFFGPKQKQGPDPAVMKMASDMNDLARRLRMLEERYINFRKKNQVTEQDMVSAHKNLNKEVKTAMSDLSELRKGINELENTMKLVLSELQNCARKEDLLVLQKYINMWEPMHFVTEDEVKKMVMANNSRKV